MLKNASGKWLVNIQIWIYIILIIIYIYMYVYVYIYIYIYMYCYVICGIYKHISDVFQMCLYLFTCRSFFVHVCCLPGWMQLVVQLRGFKVAFRAPGLRIPKSRNLRDFFSRFVWAYSKIRSLMACLYEISFYCRCFNVVHTCSYFISAKHSLWNFTSGHA